jgi:hypothetical protein
LPEKEGYKPPKVKEITKPTVQKTVDPIENIPDTTKRVRFVEDVEIPIRLKHALLPKIQIPVEKIPVKQVLKQQDPPIEKGTVPIPSIKKIMGTIPPFDENIDKIIQTMKIPEGIELSQSKPLFTKIKTEEIMRKHIPHQKELNKFMNYLKRKVLHDYTIPISVKELRAEFPNSPFFKDIYRYIIKGICTLPHGTAQKQFKIDCQEFLAIDYVLFRIKYVKYKGIEPTLLLCIPEKYISTIIYQYHNGLLAGHHGVTRMYLTLRDIFFFPNMFENIRSFLICCQECQSRRDKEKDVRIHHSRIPLDFRPMARMSADIKEMFNTTLGFHHILLCTCEVSGYVVGIPVVDQTAKSIAEAIFYKICCIYGPPSVLIMDEAQALQGQVMDILIESMNIKTHSISPQNHGSLKTERYIKTINAMICKYLEGSGDNWPQFVYPCCYAMNTFVSTSTGYSPYEMVFLHKPADLHDFNIHPDQTGQTMSAKEYKNTLSQRYKAMIDIVEIRITKEQETQRIREQRKFPEHKSFAVNDIVFVWSPHKTLLNTVSKKLVCPWLGPLFINTVLDDSHYFVRDISGRVMDIVFHENRIKRFYINLGDIKDGRIQTASTYEELAQKVRELNSLPNDTGNHISDQ